jgi:hypothetical protein
MSIQLQEISGRNDKGCLFMKTTNSLGTNNKASKLSMYTHTTGGISASTAVINA